MPRVDVCGNVCMGTCGCLDVGVAVCGCVDRDYENNQQRRLRLRVFLCVCLCVNVALFACPFGCVCTRHTPHFSCRSHILTLFLLCFCCLVSFFLCA